MLLDILYILFVVVLLGGGVASILIANYLFRKYHLVYLQSYLYYRILSFAFGIYGLLGAVLIRFILENLDSPSTTIQTIGQFLPFLGVPFLIAGWYLFIKLCRELVNKKLSSLFTLSFFSFHILFFLAYGFAIIYMSGFKTVQHDQVSNLIKLAFICLEIIVLIIALSQLFFYINQIKEKTKRSFILNFGYINLFIHSIIIVLFFYANFHFAILVVYLFVYFTGDIPPILYMGSYLHKHHKPVYSSQENKMDLGQLVKKYGISKREEEVIHLISEGKTNKEIADALFISLQTVKDHNYNIYLKTGVRNRVELVNMINSRHS